MMKFGLKKEATSLLYSSPKVIIKKKDLSLQPRGTVPHANSNLIAWRERWSTI